MATVNETVNGISELRERWFRELERAKALVEPQLVELEYYHVVLALFGLLEHLMPRE